MTKSCHIRTRLRATVITPIPELNARQDTRRYLELVVNRYELNPQPKASLIVEGSSEEKAVATTSNSILARILENMVSRSSC